MKKSLKSAMCLLALVGLFSVSAPANATTLTPGSSVAPGPINGNLIQLATTGPLAFSLADGTAGTYIEIVGKFDHNPFGANFFSFLYQIKVTSGDVHRLTGFNYAGFSTDVDQARFGGPLGAGSGAPVTADRSADGKTVGFNFPIELVPGDTSFVLFVNTDAPSYQKGLLSIIDGGTDTRMGFAPSKGVPEFGSASLMGLMLLGFSGIFAVRRLLAMA